MTSTYVCLGMCTWDHEPAEALAPELQVLEELDALHPRHRWTRSGGGGGLPPHLQGAIDFQNRRWTPGPSASPRERHHGRPLLHRANAQAPRAPRTAKPRVGSRTLTPTPKYTNPESSPVPLASGPLASALSSPAAATAGGVSRVLGGPTAKRRGPSARVPKCPSSRLPECGVVADSSMPREAGRGR